MTRTPDPRPPIPERPAGGAPCNWVYCSKWAAIVVELGHEGRDVERIWVCLTHLAHARLRGWRQVWPMSPRL